MAGITLDPWIPFWFVCTAWACHCELLLCPGASFALGIPLNQG